MNFNGLYGYSVFQINMAAVLAKSSDRQSYSCKIFAIFIMATADKQIYQPSFMVHFVNQNKTRN